jgi:hypothetical protein
MRNKSDWKWCGNCLSPYIVCPLCQAKSCCGGSCKRCRFAFGLAQREVEDAVRFAYEDLGLRQPEGFSRPPEDIVCHVCDTFGIEPPG